MDVGTPGFSGVGQDFISEELYTGPTSNTPLATGLEAALIVAESQLQAGQTNAWATSLNALRQSAPALLASGEAIDSLPSDSTTLASTTMQVDVMFRERAFWLYLTGHRLSDMRRLIRQYHRGCRDRVPDRSGRGDGVGIRHLDRVPGIVRRIEQSEFSRLSQYRPVSGAVAARSVPG